ncbi:MAG TPA: DUF6600 domain-containing protein [Terriglobales bacterium]|nr:DUF6600 domain-containing protein [Terriglobales bacterium]
MGALRRLGFTVVVLGFALFATFAASADEEKDPPGRAARLDYMSGEVSIQPGGVNDWVAATLNRPMTTADRIWTDKDSRAEVQVGTGTLRMDSETSVTLSNVSDNTVQVELDQGTLNLHVHDMFPGEIYEIDTPNTAFTVTKNGDYRFNVNSNNDVSLVTVWHGEGVATGDGPAVKIKSGQQGSFSGGRSMTNTVYEAPAPTGFDQWCAVRSKRQDSAISARYVAPGTVGADDLDEYGAWRTYPGYGPVWVPTVVVPGWAPYRFGHWVWVAPWGWTWVDDAPWGYAPFHYGRWAYIGGSWGWCPGPVYVRPVYAPALVAWVGGPNWGVSIGLGGGVGWFPLGYGEPYVPWYHAGPGYWRNVNVSNTRITNVTVINNYYNNRTAINNIHYANRMMPNAVTAVPQRAFVSSQSVARNAVPLNTASLRNAHVVGEAPFSPSRESVLGANAGRPAAIPPQQAFGRQAVHKMTPPSAPQSPFNNARVANNPAGRPNGNFGPQANQGTRVADNVPMGRNVPRPPTNYNYGASRGNNPSPAVRNPRGNENVARPYPHPPSGGERQVVRNPGGNNQPARTYSAGPQNQGGVNHTYSAPPSQPSRNYGPPQGHGGQAPEAQPHSAPRAPANNGPAREHNNTSVYGGSPTVANNYGYPRPSPGAVRPAPVSNYLSGSYSSGRNYPGRLYGYSQRASAGNNSNYSRPNYSYNAPPRSYGNAGRSYSAPSYSGNRSYSAPSYHSNGGGRSYSAPSYARSASSSPHYSGGGSRAGGGGFGHGR